MKSEIKKVITGISIDNIQNLVWVEDKFRTNTLSLTPGGTSVIIEYTNGIFLGYDKIKIPSKYIEKVWKNNIIKEFSNYESFSLNQKLELVKSKMRKVYARSIDQNKSEDELFEEVWSSENADYMPWIALEKFNDGDKYLGSL